MVNKEIVKKRLLCIFEIICVKIHTCRVTENSYHWLFKFNVAIFHGLHLLQLLLFYFYFYKTQLFLFIFYLIRSEFSSKWNKMFVCFFCFCFFAFYIECLSSFNEYIYLVHSLCTIYKGTIIMSIFVFWV